MITRTEFEYFRQIADPEERAARYAERDTDLIKLSVAENVLVYDTLRKLVFERAGVVGVADTKYRTSYGDDVFRKQTAAFLGDTFGVTIAPEHVFGVAGVSGALECLAFALLPPGSKVLIPVPCWQGFRWCFEQRPGCKVVTFAPKSPQITWKDVASALQKDPDARALVLTNPHNPLGLNYDPKNLEEIYTALLAKHPNVHIISDEMYCHSQTANAAPAFASAFALGAYKRATEAQKGRVHVVWGFAKDFGLSGFRAGVIASTSKTVREKLAGSAGQQAMAWFSPMDSLKLFLLNKLLTFQTEHGRVRDLIIKDYKEKLTKVRTAVGDALSKRQIAYLPGSNAAQFFWLDLRKYLDKTPHAFDRPLYPEVDERESRLEEYLRAGPARVQLLPGGVLSNPEPGWFRLCYTAEAPGVVLAAVKRIADALGQLPAGESSLHAEYDDVG